MAMTALVTLSGFDQSSGTLTAYVGTEVRGVQETSATAPFGPYVGKPTFQILIFGDVDGETLSFTFTTGTPPLPAPPAFPPLNYTVFEEVRTIFQNTMNLDAVVYLGGVAQSAGRIVGFVGTEMRGASELPLVIPFGPLKGVPTYALTIFGESSGDIVSLFFDDGNTLTLLDQTVAFEVKR